MTQGQAGPPEKLELRPEPVLPTESQAGKLERGDPLFYRVGRRQGASFWRQEGHDEFPLPQDRHPQRARATEREEVEPASFDSENPKH